MSDFYQSPADKLRFEILLKSLREGRLNLAILGDDEVALAHYGRRIFQHLRGQGEKHVELWTSADSERLVDRFNEILSELTLDQALDKSNKTMPKRYMIFPDTQGIQDFELQLLARLVNGFPASNINLILLINQQSSYEKKLSAFGKNLLQWVLESEEPTPGKMQRIETLDEWPGAKAVPTPAVLPKASQTPATSKSTAAPSAPPAPLATKTPQSPPLDLPPAPPPPSELMDDIPGFGLPGDPVMGEEVPLTPMPTGEELAKAWEPEKPKSRGGKIAGILLVALLLSLITFGVLYKERVVQEWQSLQMYLAGPVKPAATVTNPVAVTPPPSTVGMSSSNVPTPLKPADAISTEQGEAVVTPPAPDKVAEAPKSEVQAVKTPESAPKPDKANEKATVKDPKKAAEKAVTSDPKADDPAWVDKLKDDAWVMQHGAFDSLSEARNLQSSSLGYKAGQVFSTKRKGGKPYYILITGPYSDKAQAEALMRQNPPLAKAWLRSAKSLKEQFQE